MTHPSVLLREVFSVNPRTGVWIERAGITTRGRRPAYLDHPHHTAADMAREPWIPPKGKRT